MMKILKALAIGAAAYGAGNFAKDSAVLDPLRAKLPAMANTALPFAAAGGVAYLGYRFVMKTAAAG